jgi:predicted permease
MSRVVSLWRNLLRRNHVERELDNELSAVLELMVDEKVRSGLSVRDARNAARRELGGLESLKDQVRAVRTGVTMDHLLQDLRCGLRILRKNPTFAFVAVFTLALGTGANVAIFHLVNALLLRPLPVERSQELVSIGIDQHGKGRIGRKDVGRSVFSEPLWQEIRAQQQAFSNVFAWGSGRWDLSTEGEVVWADGFYVSGSFFGALGVPARLGRLITELDDQKGCGSPGAVLSHGFWQARWGSSLDVVGRTIMIDRRPFEIVGVAQRGFQGVEVGRSFDVALPLCAEPMLRGRDAGTGRRDVWWLDIMGRLKPGWTIERAGSHLAAISRPVLESTVSPTYPASWARDYTAFTFTATSGRTGVSMLPPVAYAVLWMLFGSTGLVLLLTCANLANLMLARSTARGREIAVRLAIGATRRRLIAQLVTESALIVALGALAGALLGGWIGRTLVTFLNQGSLPVRIVVNVATDWRVFTLTIVVASFVCLVFGLGPAFKATRRHPVTAMQPGDRSTSDGHDAVSLRRGLVVVQIAFSIVLVVGAFLFVRTLAKLNAVDLGFDPAVIVASVDLRRTAVPPTARLQAFQEIVTRMQTVSGVRHASETVIVPLSGADWNGQIVTGGTVRDGDVHFNAVGVDYFRVMETSVLKGRAFVAQDRAGAPRAAVVNETFARRYLPNSDPIGQTFEIDGARGPSRTYHVVGLVKDTKFLQVGQERTAAASRFSANQASSMFLPIAYLAASQEMVPTPADLRIVVRSDLPAARITPALTRAINDAVPGAGVSYDAVARYIDTLLLPQRLVAGLSGLFGFLAVLIASIGLYGIMSYLVTRRRVEIGVRMSLGAEPGAVVRMILLESGVLLALGLVVGVTLATIALQPAASLLYGLTPLDPASFALGTGLLGCVALLAAWFPARAASRVAPIVALRE